MTLYLVSNCYSSLHLSGLCAPGKALILRYRSARPDPRIPKGAASKEAATCRKTYHPFYPAPSRQAMAVSALLRRLLRPSRDVTTRRYWRRLGARGCYSLMWTESRLARTGAHRPVTSDQSAPVPVGLRIPRTWHTCIVIIRVLQCSFVWCCWGWSCADCLYQETDWWNWVFNGNMPFMFGRHTVERRYGEFDLERELLEDLGIDGMILLKLILH